MKTLLDNYETNYYSLPQNKIGFSSVGKLLQDDIPSNKDEKKRIELKRKSQLNSIITNASGSPDYLAINIYYDTFRSWYNPMKRYDSDGNITYINKLKTKGIYQSYKELSILYACSTETIRKKIVKLEKLGLIHRSFKHRETVTTKSYNQLIIYVWKDTPHFFNKFGIDKNEISELNPQTNHKYITKKYHISYHSKTESTQVKESRGGIHTLEDTKKLIELFSNEKNRSIKSNFFDFNSKKFFEQKPRSNYSFSFKPKKLIDFYPLSANDCHLLQSNSGREFNLISMNEILKDMSRRVGDSKIFYSKKGFIAYMSKCFQYELRDAVTISNNNFKIKSNLTDQEIKNENIEKFLANIEYSKETCSLWRFKKRIAGGIVANEVAFNILNNLRQVKIKEDKLILELTKYVELSNDEREKIMQAAKNSDLCDQMTETKQLEIKMPKYQNNYQPNQSKNGEKNVNNYKTELPDNIWGRVRKKLIETFGYDIDKNWFSKLKSELNEERKELIIKAPSNFFKDWINNNYYDDIENFVKSEGFKFKELVC